ncbi:MAG: class I SAM-dependent methyltransferase [Candidatus Desulfofervidus auxilii]|nr:class I SAM-dependent methyltransferase [Candidatus Desulfofervidus auxilii]
MLLNIMSNIKNKICMPFRYKVLLKKIKSFDNKKILDIGCGDYNPSYTQTNFPKVDYYGIDINEKVSKFFKEKYKFLKVDVENEFLPFKENIFDIVLVSHVLEHLRNIQVVVKECYRILKPDGLIYIENTISYIHNFAKYEWYFKFL